MSDHVAVRLHVAEISSLEPAKPAPKSRPTRKPTARKPAIAILTSLQEAKRDRGRKPGSPVARETPPVPVLCPVHGLWSRFGCLVCRSEAQP